MTFVIPFDQEHLQILGASFPPECGLTRGRFAMDTLNQVLCKAFFLWLFWGISWTSLYSWLVLPVNIQQVAFPPEDKGTFFGSVPCSLMESFVGVIILAGLPITDPYVNSRPQSVFSCCLGVLLPVIILYPVHPPFLCPLGEFAL